TFKKYRVYSWSSVCPHGIFFGFLGYFSLARISSALMPLASSFFSTASASVFLASSAALASAFAFFASKDATSFWPSSEQTSFFQISLQSFNVCGDG
ncbi:MAG: hypothetical protein PUE92_02375, partial [Catenibacterium mitsuokai]